MTDSNSNMDFFVYMSSLALVSSGLVLESSTSLDHNNYTSSDCLSMQPLSTQIMRVSRQSDNQVAKLKNTEGYEAIILI